MAYRSDKIIQVGKNIFYLGEVSMSDILTYITVNIKDYVLTLTPIIEGEENFLNILKGMEDCDIYDPDLTDHEEVIVLGQHLGCVYYLCSDSICEGYRSIQPCILLKNNGAQYEDGSPKSDYYFIELTNITTKDSYNFFVPLKM